MRLLSKWISTLFAVSVLTLAACSSSGSAGSSKSNGSGNDLASQFAGKTVTIVVGTTPGGDYDIIARAMQKLAPKYLPGNPRIVVVNQPTGDHLVANARVYASKPDGLTLGMANLHRWQVELLNGPEPGLDVTKVKYIGNPVATTAGALWCANRKDYSSWDDILKSGKTVTTAATAPGGAVFLIAEALELQNQPVKVVYGYEGGSETEKAFGSGESDMLARCAENYTSDHTDWLSSKKLAPIAWIGQAPTQEYLDKMGWDGPPPPSMFDLPGVSFTDDDKAAVDDVLEMSRLNAALFLPPNTPDDIVNMWVDVLKKVTVDPEFVKIASAAGDTPHFSGADEIAKVFASMQGLSAEGKEFLNKLAPVKS
jgi:tripartite-type tricarboxylate transporter receptor subunit TctC